MDVGLVYIDKFVWDRDVFGRPLSCPIFQWTLTQMNCYI